MASSTTKQQQQTRLRSRSDASSFESLSRKSRVLVNPTLIDMKSKPIRLTTLWHDRRIVLVFLRHLSCRFCWQQIAAINTIVEKLRQNDPPIHVVAVSLGTIEQAHVFINETGYTGELFMDPTLNAPKFDDKGPVNDGSRYADDDAKKRQFDTPSARDLRRHLATGAAFSYQAFRLLRGADKVLHPNAAARGEKALKDGYTDHPNLAGVAEQYVADIFQLGGVFILGPGNSCDYAYRSAYAGDHPSNSEIFSAATGRTSAGDTDYLYPSTQKWVQRLNATVESVDDDDGGGGSDNNSDEKTLKQRKRPAKTPPKTKAVASEQRPQAHGRTALSTMNFTLLSIGVAMIAIAVVLMFRERCTEYACMPVMVAFAIVIACICVAGIVLYKTSSSSSPLSSTDAADAANALQLSMDDITMQFMTVRQIDDLSMKRGAVQCDCGDVMSAIPMTLPVLDDDFKRILELREEHVNSIGGADAFTKERADDAGGVDTWNPIVSDDDLRVYETMTCYMREFLAKPHPLVGRSGPCCPFVPTSLKLDSLYFSIVHTTTTTHVDYMVAVARECVRQFVNLWPPSPGAMDPKSPPPAHRKKASSKRYTVYKAAIMVFPDISVDKCHEYIDGVQRAMKAEMVSRGMMIGEFHLHNNATGLRNPHFYPLRTPYPSLALRHMVPSDIAFLTPDQYPPQTRVSFLRSYLATLSDKNEGVGTALKGSEREKAELALKEAESVLAASARADK